MFICESLTPCNKLCASASLFAEIFGKINEKTMLFAFTIQLDEERETENIRKQMFSDYKHLYFKFVGLKVSRA